MKRFLLFTGDNYYARGGIHDFKDSFSTLEEALKEAAYISDDWFHIYDLQEQKTVEERYWSK